MLAGLLAVGTACGPASAPPSASSEHEGQAGVYWVLTVSKQPGGTVTSVDGLIACGTGGTRCGPVNYAWTKTATLVAKADAGQMFGGWAGDCGTAGRVYDPALGGYVCTLSAGADKYVVPVFGPAGQVVHPNFTAVSVHGPAFFDFVSGAPDAFTCNAAACHRATYDGAGIAPSCNACHAQRGFSDWLTNCTFCHGRRTYGYTSASQLWSAPPDAVSQRLSGTPAVRRTGKHRAHLAGRPGFVAFACASCHPVPSNVSHASNGRATMTFSARDAFPGLTAEQLAALPTPLATFDPTTATCTGYCHGSTMDGGTRPTVTWSQNAFDAPAINDCTSCHGAPPETGRTTSGDPVYCPGGCSAHVFHLAALPDLGHGGCFDCHAGNVHVSGRVEVAFPVGLTAAWDPLTKTCTAACHVTPSAAYPWH